MNIMESIQSHPWFNAKQNIRTLLLDFLIVAGMVGLVSFAHLIPFPLYKLEPMKLFLLVAILYASRGNALLMAATIPLISTATSGHPIFPKNLIIGVELMVFAGILTAKSIQTLNIPLRFLTALMASKLVYYIVKALVIYSGWLSMSLVSTSLLIQIQGAVIVFLAYWILILPKKGSEV